MGTNRMDSVAAYVSIALSIGAIVMGIVNHKRIRSSCCGKEASVSLDIESTSPVQKKTEPLVYNGTQDGTQVHSSSSKQPEVSQGRIDT